MKVKKEVRAKAKVKQVLNQVPLAILFMSNSSLVNYGSMNGY